MGRSSGQIVPSRFSSQALFIYPSPFILIGIFRLIRFADTHSHWFPASLFSFQECLILSGFWQATGKTCALLSSESICIIIKKGLLANMLMIYALNALLKTLANRKRGPKVTNHRLLPTKSLNMGKDTERTVAKKGNKGQMISLGVNVAYTNHWAKPSQTVLRWSAIWDDHQHKAEFCSLLISNNNPAWNQCKVYCNVEKDLGAIHHVNIKKLLMPTSNSLSSPTLISDLCKAHK